MDLATNLWDSLRISNSVFPGGLGALELLGSPTPRPSSSPASRPSPSVSPSPVPARTPTLQLFLQPANTTDTGAHINVSSDLRYKPIVQLAQTALNHLITSPTALSATLPTLLNTFHQDSSAKAAFCGRFGDVAPDTTILRDYLEKTPPVVIIAHLDPAASTGDEISILWGMVIQGTSSAALRNEVFVSSELSEAIVMLNESAAPEGEKLATLGLLFSTTIIHELQHCFKKHCFSSTDVTPCSATPGIKSGKYGAGIQYEILFFGFFLLVEWKSRSEALAADRMLHIHQLLAETPQSCYIIAPLEISQILGSLHGLNVFKPSFSMSTIAPAPPGAVRCRAGGRSGGSKTETKT
ncbi:hypothetical protein B0H19DRAFT_465270 [Mycena capillaripes]|nr:hypothetical protein B0H19DRAFT_465270 [Mycena capillaripes]